MRSIFISLAEPQPFRAGRRLFLELACLSTVDRGDFLLDDEINFQKCQTERRISLRPLKPDLKFL